MKTDPPMSEPTMREKTFEDQMRSKFEGRYSGLLARLARSGDYYKDSSTQALWASFQTGWKARESVIEELRSALETHQRLLVCLEDNCRVHLDLPYNCLPDCTDNDGGPYPSAWAVKIFEEARKALAASSDTGRES